MSGKRTRHVGDVASRLRGLLTRLMPGKGIGESPGGSVASASAPVSVSVTDVPGASASPKASVAPDASVSPGRLDDSDGLETSAVSSVPHAMNDPNDLRGDVPSQVAMDTEERAQSKRTASTFVDEPLNTPSSVDGHMTSTFVDHDSQTLDITGIEGATFVEAAPALADSVDPDAATFVDPEHGESAESVSSAEPADSVASDDSVDSAASANSADQPDSSAPNNPIAAPTEPDPEHSVDPNGPTLPPHYTPLPLTPLITPNPEAPEPLTLATWEHILGTDPEGQAERQAERRETRRSTFFGILSILLITISALVIGTPFAMRAAEQRQANTVSSNSANTVAGWPYPKAKEALAAARAYNQRLAKTSQSVIGEAHDPFASESGSSKASNDDSLAAKDKEYQSLLNTGEGVMGTVRIPKISVNLPIYHGTSEDALARGVGHLYGTSLPAGGKNTHTVLTGHRGLVNAELFTRLDELRKGDYIYLEVMGETFGYKVDRISVIEPSDVSKLKVEPGKDRITLMTCTPYGVNTHRLLVSGLRGKIPHPIPDPDAAPKDVRAIAVRVGLVAGGGVLAVWLWLGLLNPKRDRWMLIQHAATRPDWL